MQLPSPQCLVLHKGEALDLGPVWKGDKFCNEIKHCHSSGRHAGLLAFAVKEEVAKGCEWTPTNLPATGGGRGISGRSPPRCADALNLFQDLTFRKDISVNFQKRILSESLWVWDVVQKSKRLKTIITVLLSLVTVCGHCTQDARPQPCQACTLLAPALSFGLAETPFFFQLQGAMHSLFYFCLFLMV